MIVLVTAAAPVMIKLGLTILANSRILLCPPEDFDVLDFMPERRVLVTMTSNDGSMHLDRVDLQRQKGKGC